MFRFPAIACQIEHEERHDSAELVSERTRVHFLNSFNSLGLICGLGLQTSYKFELLQNEGSPSLLPTPFQILRSGDARARARGAMCRVPSRYFKCFGETGAAAAAVVVVVMRCMSCPGAIAPPPFVPRESPIRERP